MFILAGKTLCVIASHNKSTDRSIIVKIGLKLSGELFKTLLVTQGFDPIASRHITRKANVLLEETQLEYTLLLVFPGWTVAKQCLAIQQYYGDIEL